jgi:hypothetical protein
VKSRIAAISVAALLALPPLAACSDDDHDAKKCKKASATAQTFTKPGGGSGGGKGGGGARGGSKGKSGSKTGKNSKTKPGTGGGGVAPQPATTAKCRKK